MASRNQPSGDRADALATGLDAAASAARKPRGFLASLTPEQLTAALTYTGPDHHGPQDYRRETPPASAAPSTGEQGTDQ